MRKSNLPESILRSAAWIFCAGVWVAIVCALAAWLGGTIPLRGHARETHRRAAAAEALAERLSDQLTACAAHRVTCPEPDARDVAARRACLDGGGQWVAVPTCVIGE